MITRSNFVLENLEREHKLTDDIVGMVWRSARGQHEQVVRAVYNTLVHVVAGSSRVPHGLITALLREMRQTFVVPE